MSEPFLTAVDIDGASIATATWGDGPPEIVFLHDGLGSIAQWRGVPAAVADATGVTVMAFDRPGHGSSRPIPTGSWPTNWLHLEAQRFDALLRAVGSKAPLVVGHSDGGSIALIHAANFTNVRGLVAIAAHTWLEQEAVDEISKLRSVRDRVVQGLARHHESPGAVFDAWSGVWVSEGFSTWDIRPELAAIEIPCHIVQGDADEYGTSLQATDTATVIGSNARCTLVANGKHLLHHEQPDLVVELVVEAWGG